MSAGASSENLLHLVRIIKRGLSLNSQAKRLDRRQPHGPLGEHHRLHDPLGAVYEGSSRAGGGGPTWSADVAQHCAEGRRVQMATLRGEGKALMVKLLS